MAIRAYTPTRVGLGQYKTRMAVPLFDLQWYASYNTHYAGAGVAKPAMNDKALIPQSRVNDGSFTPEKWDASIFQNPAWAGYQFFEVSPVDAPGGEIGGPIGVDLSTLSVPYEDTWLRHDLGRIPDYGTDFAPLPTSVKLKGVRMIPHLRASNFTWGGLLFEPYIGSYAPGGNVYPPPDIGMMDGVVCAHLIAYDSTFSSPPEIVHTFTYDTSHRRAAGLPNPALVELGDNINLYGSWQTRSYTSWVELHHRPDCIYAKSGTAGPGGDYAGLPVFSPAPNVSWGFAPGMWDYDPMGVEVYPSGPDDATDPATGGEIEVHVDGPPWNAQGYIGQPVFFRDPIFATVNAEPYDIDIAIPYADVKGKWLALVLKVYHNTGQGYYGFDLAANTDSSYGFGFTCVAGPLSWDTPAPKIQTQPPTAILGTQAALHGRIGIPAYDMTANGHGGMQPQNPDTFFGGQDLNVWFDFGESDAYEFSIHVDPAGGGGGDGWAVSGLHDGWVNARIDQAGLKPGHTYHYRIRCDFYVFKDSMKVAGVVEGDFAGGVWPPPRTANGEQRGAMTTTFSDRRLGSPLGYVPGPIGTRYPDDAFGDPFHPDHSRFDKITLVGRDQSFTTPTGLVLTGQQSQGVLPAMHSTP